MFKNNKFWKHKNRRKKQINFFKILKLIINKIANILYNKINNNWKGKNKMIMKIIVIKIK